MVSEMSSDVYLAGRPMDPLFPSPSEIVAITANEDQPRLGHSFDLADLLSVPDVSQPSTHLGREISKIEMEMSEESERSFRDTLSMVCFLLFMYLCALNSQVTQDRDTLGQPHTILSRTLWLRVL
jgi:hypothetical protein